MLLAERDITQQAIMSKKKRTANCSTNKYVEDINKLRYRRYIIKIQRIYK